MKKITETEFAAVFSELFEVNEPLNAQTDLSKYVKDSIDLGELIAVLKERHGVEPQDMQLFKTRTALRDVLAIFNHESE